MKTTDLYEEITSKIIIEVENGALPWVKEWSSFSGMPENAVTGRGYNGINTLILWILGTELGYTSNRWCTFNQAKKSGASIRKGSKSLPVLFFKPLEIDERDSETGEKITIPMAKIYRVFNEDQVKGLTNEIVNSIDLIDSVDLFIKGTGVKIVPGSPAFVPSMNWIHMPPVKTFNTTAGYYATIFHEMIHWAGGKTRLNRDMSGRFGSEGYAMEELVAEIGSAFLCALFKIDGEVRHSGYIENWLKVLKSDNKAILNAAAEANKAVTYLLELTEDNELDAVKKV